MNDHIVVKTHYSATELAAMQLPGLPTTKAAFRSKADRAGWTFIESTGTGGTRREYTPPPEVMEAIKAKAAHHLVASVPAKRLALRPEDQLPLIESERQALAADARKGVLLAMDTLMARSGYPMKKAARTLIEMARKGEANPQLVAMLKMARDQRGRPSPDGLPSERSVLRFVEYERTGMLAPKKRERDMNVPAWAASFMAFYQRPEKPTVEHAYRQFVKLPETQAMKTVPSVWQVRRFLSKVGNVSLEVGRMGDRELKSLKPFIRRGFDTLLPTDIYSADGHTFDAEVQHPLHGRPFRPEITTMVDIATRKAVGWSVGLAESALAVVDALRDAVLKGGIPAILYVDNGSGYKNQMMLGYKSQLMSDVGVGMMSRLGMEMVNSLPYNSQARGVIEKLHQTIWVNAAKEVAGYIGRDMDRQAKQNIHKISRQALKVKPGEVINMPLMGWSSFVAFCEDKVHEYNSRPHRSLAKTSDPSTGRRRHMTPNEAWALAQSKGFEAHTVSDDEARPLFRPQTLRTVRRCEIELFGNRYFARALEEFHTEQLRIGYDVHNPAKVWVYTGDGRFICTAGLDANKRDYMPKSVVDRAREKRAAGRVNRLETKLGEVHAELHGMPILEQMDSVTIPGFMNMTRDELAVRARAAEVVNVVELAPTAPMREPMPEPVPDEPEWTAPTTPQARWELWQRMSVMREEELDCEKQKIWRNTYRVTAEFKNYQRQSA